MPFPAQCRRVLCVAEKPSIAKEIARILGEGQATKTDIQGNRFVKNYTFPYKVPPTAQPFEFTVTAVLGHVNEQDFHPDFKSWRARPPFSLFDAEILTGVSSTMKPVVANLKRLSRSHDLLLIWTDCDREGEHIGVEIMKHCLAGNRNIRTLRSRFSAIIPAQIHNAARNPVVLDTLSADAVDVRIELDLRTGAAITRLFTMHLQTAFAAELADMLISYGPCQFPTLGFVVDRYLQRLKFVSEDFWYIAVTQERGSNMVEFTWKRQRLFDCEIALVLYQECVENPEARVVSVETKPTKKWKPLPLTTVELQKSGSRLLRMSPKKVLEHAEKLYQKGFLSYPRTETDQFDRDFDFDSLIQKQAQDPNWGGFAQSLRDGDFERPRNGQKNDKAHPPIHPTAWTGNVEGDERRVYDLVTRRFLACCSKNAEGKTTTADILIAGEEFSTSGLVILARNYLDVYPYDKWVGSEIPDFQVGETFIPTATELKEGSTTAPTLLTEADLVGLMDKNGIGTDATIAEHIAKIIARQYVMEQNQSGIKYLAPSNLGIALVEGSNAIGFDRSLVKPHLRRETEHRMQLICDGVQTKSDVLAESLEQYKEVFVKAQQEMALIDRAMQKYLRDEIPDAQPANENRRGRGHGNNNIDQGQDNFDDDDFDSGRGGGPTRGGRAAARDARDRGAARSRGAAAPRARGRGRGGAAAAGRGRASNNDDNDAEDYKPPPARPASSVQARRSIRNEDNEDGGGDPPPQCRCNKPAIERTVMRETQNKGKKFWTCSAGKDDGCDFFEWKTDGGGPSTVTKRTYNESQNDRQPPQRRRRQDDDQQGNGPLRCQCTPSLTAVFKTVAKEGPNQGRKFWTCPNSQGAQCNFFKWDEEEAPASSRGGHGVGGSGGGDEGGQTDDACYKCHQRGHWASDCSNEVTSYGSNRFSRGGSSRGRDSSSRGRGSSRGSRGRRSQGR